MSLSNDAPSGDTAVPSVEDNTPVDSGGSGEGSGAPEGGTISVERFNGLMSAHQRVLNELNQLKAERDATPPAQPNTEDAMNDEVLAEIQALREQNTTLQNMLLNRESETAKKAALDKYPNAKHFADLIIGNSPEDIEDVARQLHERFTAATAPKGDEPPSTEAPEAPASQEPVAPAAPEPPPVPVTGGAVPFSGTASLDDQIREAKAKRDIGTWLRLKAEKAEQASQFQE